jgi:hypothetical protein
MFKTLTVENMKCVDENSQTRGVAIYCGPNSYVTLIVDESISHKKTDEMVRLLHRMKLGKILVELP